MSVDLADGYEAGNYVRLAAQPGSTEPLPQANHPIVMRSGHKAKMRCIALSIEKGTSPDNGVLCTGAANARLAVFVGTAGADFLLYRLPRRVLCARQLGANVDRVIGAE